MQSIGFEWETTTFATNNQQTFYVSHSKLNNIALKGVCKRVLIINTNLASKWLFMVFPYSSCYKFNEANSLTRPIFGSLHVILIKPWYLIKWFESFVSNNVTLHWHSNLDTTHFAQPKNPEWIHTKASSMRMCGFDECVKSRIYLTKRLTKSWSKRGRSNRK